MNLMRPVKESIKAVLWTLLADRDGLKDVRVVSGPAKGTRLRVDLRCESAYWIGTYDRRILGQLCALVHPGQVVWDCGSYLGYYAAALRKRVGRDGLVICFEGSSQNYNRLRSLPSANGWNNVKIIHMAIGPDHASLRFVSNQGAASGPADMPSKPLPETGAIVEQVTSSGLDELAYERGFPLPDLIKMDLEMGETYALRNGERLFSEKRPSALIELHKNPKTEVPPAFAAAEEFLRRFRYKGVEIHLKKEVRTIRDFFNAEEQGVQCTILATPLT